MNQTLEEIAQANRLGCFDRVEHGVYRPLGQLLYRRGIEPEPLELEFDEVDEAMLDRVRLGRVLELHPDAYSGSLIEYELVPQETMDKFLAHERQVFIEDLEQRYEQASPGSQSSLYWELRSFREQPSAPPSLTPEQRQSRRDKVLQRERDRQRITEEMERNRVKYAAYERDRAERAARAEMERRCAAGWKHWQCGDTMFFGPLPPPYDGIWKEVQRQQ